MSEKKEKIEFKVTFLPKAGWVDKVFLGNLLAEILGSFRDKHNVFDFEISALPEQG